MNRRLLIGGALALVALAIGVGVYVYNETRPTEKRGSASDEFDPAEPKKRRPKPREPWPTYAFDRQRTHLATGFDHRPPYRPLWKVVAGDTVEFPPSVAYGRVYIPQQKGRFLAVDGKTGRVVWKREFRRCAAASPTVSKGVVYQSYMDVIHCPQGRPGATGFLIAMNARTGKTIWRFDAAPFESSPLLVNGVLYVGSWDRKVYAIRARTGRKLWSFAADEEVNTSAAYWRGRIYIATDAGSLYALGARTGRLRWQAGSNSSFGSREFFYATPTVAYGRVFIGNTDGTMYAYGAKTGRLLWARPLGSYVYSAAAVWRKRVYVGTYDGAFYALDAATGDVRWKRSAPAAVHAAPTVMNGYVYFSTCNKCQNLPAQRAVKAGPGETLALDARTGRRVWRFHAGEFANPVVADSERIYITGQTTVFGLDERKRRRRDRQRAGRAAVGIVTSAALRF
jgi:outer membrane protein assembly factor BamB